MNHVDKIVNKTIAERRTAKLILAKRLESSSDDLKRLRSNQRKILGDMALALDQHVIEEIIHYNVETGELTQAHHLIEKYCWDKSNPDMNKYESVYLNTTLKYILFAYSHKPCPRFKAKYPAFCIAYGLRPGKDFTANFTNEDFLKLLITGDLNTITYFAHILDTKNELDTTKIVSSEMENPFAVVWYAEFQKTISNRDNKWWMDILKSMTQRNILTLVDTYIERGDDSLAYKILKLHYWKGDENASLCKTLYRNVDIRYVIFAYKHKPCHEFKTNYYGVCIAHGLITDERFISELTPKDFSNILTYADFSTMSCFYNYSKT